MDRFQVPLYLSALLLGAALGLTLPGIAHAFEIAINPVIVLLLYATFLGVPFRGILVAVRDWRFLVTALVVNFAVVPVVVFGLSRFIAHDRVLLIGVLFVLLTPCIDYVIVFTGLAGGARDRLLAAAPILMLGQMLLLPVYLWLFVGAEFVQVIDVTPFIEAFLLLIVLPLIVAGLTQWTANRTRWGESLEQTVSSAMVPLMMLTLVVVVASQIHGVGRQLASLLLVIPLFAGFAAIMTPIGAVAGRLARLDIPGRRAIVFTGVTRNSLVVLPLTLALPAAFGLAPLVVVTQTLVELVAMVAMVRLVPRLIPGTRTDMAG
jgi:ACR3 family arsenite efflux pump ArsB